MKLVGPTRLPSASFVSKIAHKRHCPPVGREIFTVCAVRFLFG